MTTSSINGTYKNFTFKQGVPWNPTHNEYTVYVYSGEKFLKIITSKTIDATLQDAKTWVNQQLGVSTPSTVRTGIPVSEVRGLSSAAPTTVPTGPIRPATINYPQIPELSVKAALNVVTFGAFTTALNILMMQTSMLDSPSESMVTPGGLTNLRERFGDSLVNRALAAAGSKRDIISVAQAVDQELTKDIRAKYSDKQIIIAARKTRIKGIGTIPAATNAAVAASTQAKQVSVASTQANQVSAASTANISFGNKFRAGRPKHGVKDTKTNITYNSIHAAAKALAPEFPAIDTKKMMWEYKVINAANQKTKQNPNGINRIVDV